MPLMLKQASMFGVVLWRGQMRAAVSALRSRSSGQRLSPPLSAPANSTAFLRATISQWLMYCANLSTAADRDRPTSTVSVSRTPQSTARGRPQPQSNRPRPRSTAPPSVTPLSVAAPTSAAAAARPLRQPELPDVSAANQQIEAYLKLASPQKHQTMKLIDMLWAIVKSRVSSAASAADQFALVKRIVKAVTSNPAQNLSPKDQTLTALKLLWGMSELGQALNRWGAAYGIESLSLICSELLEPSPMVMAAAAGPKVMVALSMLINVNGRNIPPENRAYLFIACLHALML